MVFCIYTISLSKLNHFTVRFQSFYPQNLIISSGEMIKFSTCYFKAYKVGAWLCRAIHIACITKLTFV